MGLKNLPIDTAAPLASLIDAAPGTVASTMFSQLDDACSITLLAFAEGEDVSGEAYDGDTLYYLVEGSIAVSLPDRAVEVGPGEVLAVPAGTLHAVAPHGKVKLLQITL